jgi:hypothetical protein
MAGFEVVDTPNNVTRFLPRMDGVKAVIRYLTRGNPNGEKHVKPAEARAIKAAGMKLGLVYETWGDLAHAGRGGISAEDGAKDGPYARQMLPTLGAPAGACVYFAIDTDVPRAALKENVLPYFKEVHAAFSDGEYKVGIYGPGWLCQAVHDAGYVDYTWLANAKGWKGYNVWKPNANLVQRLPTHIAGGLDVDPNDAQTPEWGQFTPFEQDAEIFDTPIRLGQGVQEDDNDVVRNPIVRSTSESPLTTITEVASAAGVTTGVAKSFFRSKVPWLTGGLSTAGVGTTVASDPDALHLVGQLLSRPAVWLGFACVVMAGLLLYFYWRDHHGPKA